MKKKLLVLLTMVFMSANLVAVGIGLKYGSDTSLTILADDIRVDIGVNTENFDNFTLSVDKMLTYDLLYVGVGVKAINSNNFDIGARLPVGVSLSASFIELFGEVVPTYYVDRAFDLEYGIGFRIHF